GRLPSRPLLLSPREEVQPLPVDGSRAGRQGRDLEAGVSSSTTTQGTLTWPETSVLITGGTGSFGNKFVEMMLSRYHPRRLVIFSRDELKQSEMMARFPDPSIRFFVGDVRDKERLERAMHGIDDVV